MIENRIVKKKGSEELKEVKIPTVTRRPATGILTRGVLIEPHLYLAFTTAELADRASTQHICLCRNEDILLPEVIFQVTKDEWESDQFPGFELKSGSAEAALFKVGYNRFENAAPMYGSIVSYGDPIRKRTEFL